MLGVCVICSWDLGVGWVLPFVSFPGSSRCLVLLPLVVRCLVRWCTAATGTERLRVRLEVA